MSRTSVVSPQTKAKAYDLYMSSDMKIGQIADHLKVNVNTLKSWIKEDDWPTKKKELYAQMLEDVDTEFLQLVRKERLSVAKRHLEIARNLELSIAEKVAPDPETGKARFLRAADALKIAQALKSATDVSSRASGLDKALDSTLGQNTSARPVLALGIKVNVVPEEKPQKPVINVTPKKKSVPF